VDRTVLRTSGLAALIFLTLYGGVRVREEEAAAAAAAAVGPFPVKQIRGLDVALRPLVFPA
jgi:hypothetical protein